MQQDSHARHLTNHRGGCRAQHTVGGDQHAAPGDVDDAADDTYEEQHASGIRRDRLGVEDEEGKDKEQADSQDLQNTRSG